MMLNNNIISDKELFKQMIERDIVNLYGTISRNNSILTLQPVRDKVYSYADTGIEYLTNILFGADDSGTIDDASDMAKFMAEDKINEYREKIKAKKAISEELDENSNR